MRLSGAADIATRPRSCFLSLIVDFDSAAAHAGRPRSASRSGRSGAGAVRSLFLAALANSDSTSYLFQNDKLRYLN